MQLLTFSVGALYFLMVLVLCTFLLIRGITHLFVGLFACGAFLHVLQMLGFFYLQRTPGGFGANSHLLPIFSAVGSFGTIVSAVAFVSLTMFLLKNKAS